MEGASDLFLIHSYRKSDNISPYSITTNNVFSMSLTPQACFVKDVEIDIQSSETSVYFR